MMRKRTYRIAETGQTATVTQVKLRGGPALQVEFNDGWKKTFPIGTGKVHPEYAVEFAVLARKRGEPSNDGSEENPLNTTRNVLLGVAALGALTAVVYAVNASANPAAPPVSTFTPPAGSTVVTDADSDKTISLVAGASATAATPGIFYLQSAYDNTPTVTPLTGVIQITLVPGGGAWLITAVGVGQAILSWGGSNVLTINVTNAALATGTAPTGTNESGV